MGTIDVLFKDGKCSVRVRPRGNKTTLAASTIVLQRETGTMRGRVVFADGNPLNLCRVNILAGTPTEAAAAAGGGQKRRNGEKRGRGVTEGRRRAGRR